MFGVSLSPKMFLPHTQTDSELRVLNEYGGTEGLLSALRGLGVKSVELRSVSPNDRPEDVLLCADMLERNGLSLTVHGHLPQSPLPFSQCYTSLLPLLASKKEGDQPLIITLHAYTDPENTALAAEKTNSILRLWAEEAEELGFRLALELNRDKKNGDPSVTCEGVLAMLEGISRENAGICFDMGHYFSNTGDPSVLPCGEFMDRVIHTHIHALGPGGTHFPFAPDTKLPLDAYVAHLHSFGYGGLFNLELDFPRFPDRSSRLAVRDSVTALKGSVRRACPMSPGGLAALSARTDAIYPGSLENVCRELDRTSPEEDVFWPICPSGYFFSIHGVRFALDPAIRSHSARRSSANAMAKLLSRADFVFITHDHDDHFDPELIRMMGPLPCKWIVGGEFDPELLKSTRLTDAVSVSPGDVLSLPGITAEVFNGCHFGADGTGVPSVMYLLNVGGRSVFFPGDVRDYGADRMPSIPPPDVMFANLWLGRGMALRTPDGAFEEFCDYVSFFRPGKVFLGHLFELTRSPGDMWTLSHAGRVSDGLALHDPVIPAQALSLFQKYSL